MKHNESHATSGWSPPGPLGAHLDHDTCTFRVWAPYAERVNLQLHDANRAVPMCRQQRGYFVATVDGVQDGSRYGFMLDGRDTILPDPASRSQPDGVHGASAVLANAFAWTDTAWRAPEMQDLVLYELHVGTFTRDGTFDAIIPELARLRDVGINAIELLPVAQFSGERNWGYDGVFPFAAQNSYGGANALKRLVDAAHSAGIAIILDVVYNHVGPEGNRLPHFAPYFTAKYGTPWGDALNFDDASSDEVRAFFIQSALQWIDEFHVDGLRFDAVHAIFDAAARPFLAELTDTLHERAARLGRTIYLIAESDLADPRIITSTARAGYGFDAQWLDDFHHALHTLVTGENSGYYADYGELRHFALALERAYVYAGEYSEFRKRRHGAPAHDAIPTQFVVCAQNHDQIGNRLAGDRLSTLVPFDKLKLVAAATLLGPYIPMLFMGEEYGEESPFPYFTSHQDPDLINAVRRGRAQEFASFGWDIQPPDPQDAATFQSAKIDVGRTTHRKHRALLDLHRDLIEARRSCRLVNGFENLVVETVVDKQTIVVDRRAGHETLRLVLNFGDAAFENTIPRSTSLLITTSDTRYSEHAPDAPCHARATISDSLTVAPRSAILVLLNGMTHPEMRPELQQRARS